MLGSTYNDFSGADMAKAMYIACHDYAAKRAGRSYHYLFTRRLPGDQAGAFHSSELWYVFGTLAKCWKPFGQEDDALSETMMSCFIRFFERGDPNGDDLLRWEAYGDRQSVMHFDTVCRPSGFDGELRFSADEE
jgi:para-nitrobenzyl esterase